jgi:hypothetical protein
MASLVYEQGKSTVKTRTTGTGFAPSKAENHFSFGRATTTGVQQTELSKKAAPPSGMLLTVILGAATLLSTIAGFQNPAWFILAVPFGAALYFVAPAEAREHDAAMTKWKQTRMCQRCGTFYVSDARDR